MVGRTISHYKILSEVGRGGMGVVYKAQDTKLERTVALKFLPIDKLEGEEEKIRFLREGQAAAVLNHPNICTIYEIDEADGHSFIAMEFVEGQSVKQKIESRPLKLEEALDIAVQVGQGLQVAHQNAVVHRDIKSSNVMVTAQGLVKVMDFGLAQLGDRSKLTRTGSTLGTPSYMSPEQAQGRPTDRRSDIWSLGVVLYEMVSGQLPFKGEVEAAVTYAILNAEPEPLTALRSGLPIELDRVITKALAKAPDERYQHVEEMLVDLRALQKKRKAGASQQVPMPAALATTSPKLWYAGAAGLLLLLIAVATFWFQFIRPSTERPAPPLTAVPFTTFSGEERQPALSPDGDQVAFVWGGENGDNDDVYVQLVGAGSPLRLTSDPAPDTSPAWSPDGRYIAFQRGGEVFMVPALGGTERNLGETTSNRRIPFGGLEGVSWSPDGKSLAVSDRSSRQAPFGIFLLSIETGEKQRLTSLPAEYAEGHYSGDRKPVFSPDGQSLAFERHRGAGAGDLYLTPIGEDGTAAGEPIRLTFDQRPIMGFAWTPDGRSIVFSSNRAGGRRLWRISASGGEPEQLAVGENASYPSIARQAPRLVYQQSFSDSNIWRTAGPSSADQGSTGKGSLPTKWISSTRGEGSPQFSPDGKRITFSSNRSGSSEIWVCDSDRSNAVQLTSLGVQAIGSPRWSPDSQRIAFDARKEGHADIYVVSAEGGLARRLTEEASGEVRPSWSSDGRWVYFGSNRSGEWQVWKAPSEGGPAVQVTQEGGREAFESFDGKFVYYAKLVVSGIWRVPVEGGEESQVLDQGRHGGWDLFEQGICFLNRDSVPGPTFEFFSFATHQQTQVVAFPEGTAFSGGNVLTVSPDGRWILYGKVDQTGADIMLVEDFR